MLERHSLKHEFPQFEEKITALKTSDAHFRKLFDEYDELDHHIYRIENETEPTTDEVLNALQVKRVHLKDELYKYLIK